MFYSFETSSNPGDDDESLDQLCSRIKELPLYNVSVQKEIATGGRSKRNEFASPTKRLIRERPMKLSSAFSFANLSSQAIDATKATSKQNKTLCSFDATLRTSYVEDGKTQRSLVQKSEELKAVQTSCEDGEGYRRLNIGEYENETAILRYSPPRSRSPSKMAPKEIIVTPPQSPSKSRLTSPKKVKSIPPTPHRPSIDAFWNQETINSWNDEYSPRKKLEASPAKGQQSENKATTFPRSARQSPTKEDRKARRLFDLQKHALAEDFFKELDDKISDGKIQQLTKQSGGVRLFWSKKLNTTAGRAHWKRDFVKADLIDTERAPSHNQCKHIASIELAEKVIDDEHRLLNVIAHEYCHLANFMISNVRTNPHGSSFKQWASQVTATFRDRGVEVTTKHDYEIAYKYAWVCTNENGCGVEYERHSRSIDPKKHTCGRCKSRLVQIRPPPRGSSKADNNTATPAKGQELPAKGHNAPKISDYQLFVKTHFRTIRNELGQASPLKDVMKELGARYRERRALVSQTEIAQVQTKKLPASAEIIEITSDTDETEDNDDGDNDDDDDDDDAFLSCVDDDKDDHYDGEDLVKSSKRSNSTDEVVGVDVVGDLARGMDFLDLRNS